MSNLFIDIISDWLYKEFGDAVRIEFDMISGCIYIQHHHLACCRDGIIESSMKQLEDKFYISDPEFFNKFKHFISNALIRCIHKGITG